MIEAASFFLAISAVLGFSTWAEGWLAASSRITQRSPDTTSAVHDFLEPGAEPDAVRAA